MSTACTAGDLSMPDTPNTFQDVSEDHFCVWPHPYAYSTDITMYPIGQTPKTHKNFTNNLLMKAWAPLGKEYEQPLENEMESPILPPWSTLANLVWKMLPHLPCLSKFPPSELILVDKPQYYERKKMRSDLWSCRVLYTELTSLVFQNAIWIWKWWH